MARWNFDFTDTLAVKGVVKVCNSNPSPASRWAAR
jgi:hypothetical protein